MDLDNDDPVTVYLRELATLPPLTRKKKSTYSTNQRKQVSWQRPPRGVCSKAGSPWSCQLQSDTHILA
jgi:hypothetical protein